MAYSKKVKNEFKDKKRNNYDFNYSYPYIETNKDRTLAINYDDIERETTPNAIKFKKLLHLVGKGSMTLDDIKSCSPGLSNWALLHLDKLVEEQSYTFNNKKNKRQHSNRENALNRFSTFRIEDFQSNGHLVDLPRVLMCYLAMPALFERMVALDENDNPKLRNKKLQLIDLQDELINDRQFPRLFTYSYLVEMEVFRWKYHNERHIIKEFNDIDIVLENNHKNLLYADEIRKSYIEIVSHLGKDFEKHIGLPKDYNFDEATNIKHNGNYITPRNKQIYVFNLSEEQIDEMVHCDKKFIKAETICKERTNFPLYTANFYVGKIHKQNNEEYNDEFSKEQLIEKIKERHNDNANEKEQNSKNQEDDTEDCLFETIIELTMLEDEESGEEFCLQASKALYVLLQGKMDGSCLIARDDMTIDNYRKHTNKDIGDNKVYRDTIYGSHRHIYDKEYALCNPSKPTSPNAITIPNYICANGLNVKKGTAEFNKIVGIENYFDKELGGKNE